MVEELGRLKIEGSTRPDLVAKALSHRDHLLREEAPIVVSGVLHEAYEEAAVQESKKRPAVSSAIQTLRRCKFCAARLGKNSGSISTRAAFVADIPRRFIQNKETLDGASDAQLRARFNGMLSGDEGERLSKRIRTSCFLVTDKSVIKSAIPLSPYVATYANSCLEMAVHILDDNPVAYIRAVDPEYGVPAAVCFYAERGVPAPGDAPRKGWHSIYVQTRTPEV
ncbi:hypothetical protein N0V88_000609 [Collariella sp. IMI 366227]|nr:hypothetical protein N0V88_000609 [Collariella sp. IMI 366227]